MEKCKGSKIKKINPRNYTVTFDTAAFLHQDRIKEIMNIDHLEKTLDDVLTISSDDMASMLHSSDEVSLLKGNL